MVNYSVYILASKRNGTLYVGFTSELIQRVYAHKNDSVEGFTKKYEFIYSYITKQVATTKELFNERNR